MTAFDRNTVSFVLLGGCTVIFFSLLSVPDVYDVPVGKTFQVRNTMRTGTGAPRLHALLL